MLIFYILGIALILGCVLAACTDISADGCFGISMILIIIGTVFTFSISDNEADRVEVKHETYEIISLEEAGLVPPYDETDYGVYTENGNIGVYCRLENGLIEFTEISDVEFRESMEPRYELIEYDHKEGAERHLKVNLYKSERIVYLPAGATIRPVYLTKEG